MANPYRVTINSISTDGTSLFLDVTVFDGVHDLPPIQPTFAVGTSAATIRNYLQTIANNQPVLSGDIAALVRTVIVGA
jgi:hypothetical protein